MAASVAVGVGVALAKAELDRRGARARSARGRRFELWPEERPAQGLRRMAREQVDLAIELLEGDSEGALAENAVHDTRKALKRLRALIRLLAGELGAQEAARENAVLRDAGRRLATTRDAEVLVATLDGLLERNPAELADRAGVAALRARLAAEREAVAEAASGDTRTREQVLAELRAARGRISEWRLPDRDGIETVEPGLSRIYRQGRRRHRRAARGEGDRARLLHMWRKRVKDLRYAAEMLDRFDPGAGHGSGRRTRARRWPKRHQRQTETEAIRRTARRADVLGELLGDEHDLVLLATRIRAESDPGSAPGHTEHLDGGHADDRGAGSGNSHTEDSEVGVGLGGPDLRAAQVDGAEDADAGAEADGDANPRPGAGELARTSAEAAPRASEPPGGGDVAVANDRATNVGGPNRNPEVPGPDETRAVRRPDGGATGARDADGGVDGGTRSILLKLIGQRRRRLRREALRQGGRLYRRRPKAFVARTRDAYERAARR